VLVDKKLTPGELAESLLEEESWRQILSSLVICFFAREIYTRETVLGCLGSNGIELTPGKLLEIGRDIHREKFRFKMREGFSFETLRIPHRIFETDSPVPYLTEEYVRATIENVKKALT